MAIRRFFGAFKFGRRHERSGSLSLEDGLVPSDSKQNDADVDAQITRRLLAAQKEEKKVRKLLLLGAGESGKSTFRKQLSFLFLEDRTLPKMRQIEAKQTVYQNVVTIILTLINAAQENRIELPQHARHFLKKYQNDEGKIIFREQIIMTEELAETLLEFSKLEPVQRIYQQRLTLLPQAMDNIEYFMESMPRLLESDYIPVFQDWVHIQHRTVGSQVIDFEYEEKNGQREVYRIVDVGGQRCERQKWIHFFDDVFAIIFLCSLAGFDQSLFELGTKNKLIESFELFDSILRLPVFQKRSVVIFLNKEDLFLRKIQKIPFNRHGHFPDFTGNPHDPDSVIRYIEQKFYNFNRSPRRALYFHRTTATNTSNIELVFGVVHDTIVRNALFAGGLL